MKDIFVISAIVYMCFTLAFSVCPSGWARRESSCYYIFQDKLNRSEASLRCRAHSSTLVSFSDQGDWDYIASLVKVSHLDTGFWTGLVRVAGAWQWDDSKAYRELFRWQTPNQPGVNYMGYVPPISSMTWVKLINAESDVFLQLEANSTSLHPFCKRDIDARDLCDTSENWVTLNAECYKLFPPSTWADAVSTCLATSGNLLAPTTASDLSALGSMLSPNISIWVDATDTGNLGIFYTSKKSRVSYLPWLIDPDGFGYALNANKTCAMATFNYSHFGYQTQNCNMELPFVCETPIGTCPLGWIQDELECYQLHIRPEEKMTWSVGVDYCSRQGATMTQYDLTQRAKTILNKELQDNDINLIWTGFSGTGHNFRYIGNDVVIDKVIEYDTTDVTGTNSRCGVTDLSPDKTLDLAVYCFTPRNFVCTAPLTVTINEISPPNIQCDSGWTIYNNYCVKIESSSANFTAAQQACIRENASLFIINNDIDQSLFSTPMFLSESIDYYWIGVTYDVTKSAYTLVSSSNQPKVLNFVPNLRYSPSEGPCVFVQTGSSAPFIGAWIRDLCSSTHKFVCQKEGIQVATPTSNTVTSWSPRCSVGWIYSSDTNECYLVSAFTRKTWQDGRAECLSQGGDLLSISGQGEQTFIETLLKSKDFKHLEQPLWIGIKDTWNGHGWGWSDNKPLRYLHWDEANPDYDSDDGDNCGYIPTAKSFAWESRSCLERLGFVCKTNSKPEQDGEFPTQAPFKTCNPEPLVSGQRSLQFPSSFSASSYLDQNHRPQDCRLLQSQLSCGDDQGSCGPSRAWSPANDSTDEWLAIQFHSPVTITDLLLNGENSTDKYVTKFKLQYQYDPSSPWMWVSDSDRQIKIFDGVSSPDSSTSILLVGDIQAQAIKIWPVEWSYGIAIQIEINGCFEDLCRPEYAMSGPLLVSDEQITASSSKAGNEPRNARLRLVHENQQLLDYWIPVNGDLSPWIQVDFGKKRLVRGLTLQGNSMVNNYVTKFQLQFSQTGNASDFINYTEPYGVAKIFDGVGPNQQSPTIVYLKSSVEARIVRIVVVDKNLQAALKFDVLVCSTGCQSNPVMTNTTNYKLTALDSQEFHRPERSKLNTQKRGDLADGWKPQNDRLADSSYITVDIGTVMLVTAVATQGSASENSWVRSYYLEYSSDGQLYSRYGGNVTYQGRIVYNSTLFLQGNFDNSTVVKTELSPPVSARFVRLWPHEFHFSIALRWEVYTCPVPVDTPIGCYSDMAADPDLPYVPRQDPYASISPTICVSHCYRQGYHFAGVENGTQCSCGNSYGMYGPSNDCSMLCQDPYSDSVCGGQSSNLIYNTGLGLSSLVCPDGWTMYRSHCYLMFASNLTWFYAASACGNMSSSLVDIQDHTENLFVASLLNPVVTKAWIGLNDYKQSLTYEWLSQAPVYYTNWGTHQPTVNSGIYFHSVVIDQNGSWSTVSSENLFAFICKMNKIQSSQPISNRLDVGCPLGWIAYNYKCIQVNRLKNSWSGARSVCELDGAALLHIESSQENDFVSSLLTKADGLYWTDISDATSSGLYQHFSGMAAVSYTNWGDGKPDSSGPCVGVNSGYLAGSWSNSPCETKNRFLCQRPRNLTAPGTTPTQALTTKSAPQCASGWLDAGDNQCYKIFGNSSVAHLNWHEASVECRKKGANLASFHSAGSFSSVVNSLRKLTPDVGNVWIGLDSFDQTSGYTWIDRSVMNFVKWGDDQPARSNSDYMCGELLTVTGSMGLQSCTQLKAWVCSIDKGKPEVDVPPIVYPLPDKDGNCTNTPGIWIKYKGNCYYISDGQGGADRSLTWRESRDWCGMHGADLVSINSQDENLFLQGLLNYGIPPTSVWIGLNELDRNNGYIWSDGSPLGKWGLNWNVNEPNDESGFEACAELLVRNGKWNDQNCAKKQGFICKQLSVGTNTSHHVPPQPEGNCPDQFVTFGQKCYRVMGLGRVSSSLSWNDAYMSCRNMKVYTSINNYTVDLASISSELENAFITTLLVDARKPAWIGLRKHVGGQLYWSDNEDLTFEDWDRGEPNMAPTNEGCVYIDGSGQSAGKWRDEVCDQQMAYICQGYTDPSILPVLVPPSAKCDSQQGYHRLGKSCLKLVNQTVTWQQAQQGCSSMGGHLLSVLDSFDAAESLLLAKDIDLGIWIGLNDIQTPGTYVWDSGYPVIYSKWGQHQPLDEPGWGCVYMTKNGYFNNGYCSGTRAYVCRIDYETPQFSPTKLGGYCINHEFTLSGSGCYLLVTNQSVSYDTALRECSNRQATLASVHSTSQSFNFSGTQDLWIGLRETINGGYNWEDRTAVDFTRWASGQPDWSGFDEADEGCVSMNSRGEWTNRHCQDKLGYLCMAPRSFNSDHPEITSIPTTSTAVPTRPPITTPTTTTTNMATLRPTLPTQTVPTQPWVMPSASGTTTTSATPSQPTFVSRAVTQAATSVSKLSSGDIAGIVIGVIICLVAIALVALFLVRRYGLLKSSFLRQEASRSKNFENSLYEDAHKDPLSELVADDDAVSILGLDSRGHHVSVSYTAKDRSTSVNPSAVTVDKNASAPYVHFEDDGKSEV